MAGQSGVDRLGPAADAGRDRRDRQRRPRPVAFADGHVDLVQGGRLKKLVQARQAAEQQLRSPNAAAAGGFE